MKTKHTLLIASCVMAAVMCFGVFNVQNTHAATITWNGSGADASWTDAANWVGGAVPGSSDVALFNNTCTSNCNVAINQSISVLGISVSSSFRGSITQDSGSVITIGTSGFYMGGPNNGTAEGTPSSPSSTYYGSGKYGPFAMFFNGSNNGVATSKLLSGAQKYSLSLWFRSSTSTSSGLLIGFGNSQVGVSTNYDRQIYLTASGTLMFDNYNGSFQTVASPSSSYNDGNWHNVVGTLDNSGQDLYVDGALVASSTNTAAKSFNGYWKIGHGNLSGVPNAPVDYYYAGLVDDARIYNRALSASEILNLYNNSTTLNGLQDYYAFDEGTGSTAYDTAGNYTFIGSSNASDTITIAGNMTVDGGSFKSTAGNLYEYRSMTLAPGTFNANNGTVYFASTTQSEVGCNGSPFNRVVFSKYQHGGNLITIDAGCTIPLGTDAVSYLNACYGPWGENALTNYGTITVDNWTIDDSNACTYQARLSTITNYGTITDNGTFTTTVSNGAFGNFFNYGTITVNGNSWTGSGVVNETGSSDFTFNGTSMTIYDDLEIASGTADFPNAPSGVDVTTTGQFRTIFGCISGQFGQVFLNKNDGTDSPITVNAGCTVPLGTDATSHLNVCYGPWGANALTNYGLITVDNWTLDDANGCNYQAKLASVTNYGTITNSGNFTTTSTVGRFGDFFNYGTLTVNGSSWTGSGVVNETATSSFTYKGTAMTVYGDLEIASGSVSFPNASSSGLSVLAAGQENTTLGCDSGQFHDVTIDKEGTQSMRSNQAVTVQANCVVPLGDSSSTSIFPGGGFTGLLNYGTVTVGDWTISQGGGCCNNNWVSNYGLITVSGSLTANRFGNASDFGNFFNYGTLTVNGSSWTGSGVVNETATSSFTYKGTAITVYGDLEIASGTVSLPNASSGVAVTAGGNLETTLGCTSNQISQLVSATKGDSNRIGTDNLTILAGCTVPLASGFLLTEPYAYNTLINYGTIPTGSLAITVSNDWSCGGPYATNYGSITLSGSVTLTNRKCGRGFGDFRNYGDFTMSGGNWRGGGFINESATSSFNFGGTTITVDRDFEIAEGSTFVNGSNLVMQNGNQSATFEPGGYSYGSLTFDKGNQATTVSSTASYINDTGNLVYYGGNLSTPNPYTFNVQGNYIENASGHVFANTSTTVNFNGSGTSTVKMYSGTYGANLKVSKNGIDAVQLSTNFAVVSGTCAVDSGTFDVNSHNFTCGHAFTVASGGWFADYDGLEPSTTISFGGGVTNNGMVFLDGSVPASCASSSPDNNILIRSAVSGTQQTWSGVGKFVMRYLDVQDQAASGITIDDWNGIDSGNNSGWNFLSNMPVPELVQGVSGHAASVASTSLQFGYHPKIGDFIVVAAATRGQGVLIPTDSAGNTYTEVTSKSFTSSSVPYNLGIYYAQNVKATSTFSVTLQGTSGAAGTLLSGSAFEYTGVDPSSILDNFSANTDASGTAVQLTSNNAQSFANEIMVGASMFDTQGDILAHGTGWTPEAGVSTNDTNDQALYVEDMLPTSSVTDAATWTATNLDASSTASTSYNDILAVFTALPGVPVHNYAPSGTLDSVVFDTQDAAGAQLNLIVWQGTQPSGTSVGFQVAVSNSSSGPWTFIGPSGDGTTYFTGNPASPISLEGPTAGYSLFTSYRYFRYRVILFSNPTGTATPTVNNITVNWSP